MGKTLANGSGFANFAKVFPATVCATRYIATWLVTLYDPLCTVITLIRVESGSHLLTHLTH